MQSIVYFLNFLAFISTSVSILMAFFSGGFSVLVGLLLLPFTLTSAICLYAVLRKKWKAGGIVCSYISAITALLLTIGTSFHMPLLLWFLPLAYINILYFASIDRAPAKTPPSEPSLAARVQLNIRTWWKKWGRICLVTASLLGLCTAGTLLWCYTEGFTLRFYSAAEINKNPSILTGKTLRNTVLSDLVLENVTIENALFTNTTFKNCTFILCSGVDMAFDRVLFDGGSILGFANADTIAPDTVATQRPTSIFAAGKKFAVIFQAVSFAAVQFTNIVEGTVIIKNCTFMNRFTNKSMFTGRDTVLRIDNCSIRMTSLAEIGGNSKAYITNSTLETITFWGKLGILYIDNCTAISVGATPFCHVIKNSRIGLSISTPAGGRAWLVNNSFIPKPTFESFDIFGDPNATVHIIGKGKEPTMFEIYSSTVFIENITLYKSGLGWLSSEDTMPRIHLKNVDIQYSRLNNDAVQGGTWQNVRLYPEIRTSRRYSTPADKTDSSAKPTPPEDTPLLVHELNFPQGEPWEQGAVPPTMAISPTPLPWPDVQVPTAEGLGLEDIPLSWSRE